MPFRVSAKYAEFDSFLPKFIAYATTNMVRLAISQATIDNFTALQTAWNIAFDVYSDRATQTPGSREVMKTNYTNCDTEVRKVQQSLKANAEITLTDDDYTQLDIHRDKTTRTPMPVPTIAPINILLESKHLTNKVSSNEPNTDAENRIRLPDFAHSISRMVATTETDEPPAITAYHPIDSVGRGVHMIIWNDEDNGKHGWLITQYANYKGETGPNSEPLRLPIF